MNSEPQWQTEVLLFSFSQKGHQTAKRIATVFDKVDHRTNFSEVRLKKQVEEGFQTHRCLVFVGAVGIAVRAIAPFVVSKDKDPAVLVVDELGGFVIPLLSGHLGGANELASWLANQLGATAVVTTATDLNGVFAVDNWAKKERLYIHDIGQIKWVSSALLRGETVGVTSEYPVEQLPSFLVESEQPTTGILLADQYRAVYEHTLWMTPKRVIVGVGCRKNTDPAQFSEAMTQFLATQNVALEQVYAVASIDLKQDEEAILSYCQTHQLPFVTFTAEQLAQAKGEFTPSRFVQGVTGVDNVCERSAVTLAQSAVTVPKTVIQHCTFAMATREWRCHIESGNDRTGLSVSKH